MLKLEVVNRCIATLGEAPLNSLDDTHAYLSAALDTLDAVNRELQAPGRWFNDETLTMTPSPLDGSIYLPGDVLEVITSSSRIVQRGGRLYNLDGGTFTFTSNEKVRLVRLVDFEDLPEVAAAYVRAMTVLRFQAEYDGDSEKTRQLRLFVEAALKEFGRAEVRNRHVNMIERHTRLALLAARTRRLRRW